MLILNAKTIENLNRSGRVAGGGDIPDPGRVAGGGDIPDPGRVAGGGEIYRASGINARLIVVLSKLLHQKFLKVT